MYTPTRDIILGKTLKEIKIAQDKKALLLVFSDGQMIVRADGDCCSSSWVEHIEMCDLPAMITKVDDLDLPGGNEHDGECLQVYGCKISTDKGEIVIDYRNESNGYYGGNLTWGVDDNHYGGVHGQNNSKCEWVPVKGDI